MRLTDGQDKWLRWLVANGGEAIISGSHVVSVSTTEKAAASASIVFLHLLSKGALFFRGGRLSVSDYGRRLLAP